MDQVVKNVMTISEIPIPKILEVIKQIVGNFATSTKQLQNQLDDQKRVTDWVIKEYSLRPVKKVN